MQLLSTGFFLLFACSLNGGVERFLQPISLDFSQDQKVEKKVSAYVSSPAFIKDKFHHEVEDDQEVLDAGLLQKRLGELLKHRFQANGEVKVYLSRKWEAVSYSSNFVIKLSTCTPDELNSNCFVKFDIWDDGVKVGVFSTPIKIMHLEDVYFTDKSISNGEKLSVHSLKSRKVDTLKQYASSVLVGAKLAGYEVSTQLRPDTPLKWNHLSKINLISKGKVVDVFASGNGIFVTMKGLALEDGVEGSFVRVRNLSSEKEFQAKVLSENSVKVHL